MLPPGVYLSPHLKAILQLCGLKVSNIRLAVKKSIKCISAKAIQIISRKSVRYRFLHLGASAAVAVVVVVAGDRRAKYLPARYRHLVRRALR